MTWSPSIFFYLCFILQGQVVFSAQFQWGKFLSSTLYYYKCMTSVSYGFSACMEWSEKSSQSFNALCLWKRHKKKVHGDPILLFEGFLFFRPSQVLWLVLFQECTTQALRFIMISPYAIYLTFPVAVHLSSHRQKHDRKGEKMSKRFCQTGE